MYKNYNHKKYIESHKYVNKESIFKVGDWVVLKTPTSYTYKPKQPHLVTDIYLGNNKYPQQINASSLVGGPFYSVDYKPWQPEPGEWCWFWDIQGHPILGKFKNRKYNKRFKDSVSKEGFQFCEPFIGDLPTCLKIKK